MNNRLTFEFFNDLDHDTMQKIIEMGAHHEALSGIFRYFVGCFGM